MSLLGSAYVAIKADDNPLRQGLRDAERLVEKSANAMESAFRRSGALRAAERLPAVMNRGFQQVHATIFSLRGALAGLGLGVMAREVVQYADSWNLVEGRIKLVTSSTRELAVRQEELFRIAQNARVGYEGTADLYARLARNTKNLDIEQSKLLTTTDAISKALIISGASAESADAALVQLGQGMAADALRGQELMSVMEQTPRVAEAIADGLGVGIGALRQMAEEGKLTAKTVIDAITSQADVIDKEFTRMPKTVGQAWTQIQNSTLRAIGYMDDAGNASGQLADAISEIAFEIDEWITKNDELLKQRVPEYVNAIKDGVKGVVDVYNSLPDGVVGPAATGILGAIFFGSLKAGAITSFLTLAGDAFGTMAARIKNVSEWAASNPLLAQIKEAEYEVAQLEKKVAEQAGKLFKDSYWETELKEARANLAELTEEYERYQLVVRMSEQNEHARLMSRVAEKTDEAAKATKDYSKELKELEKEAKRIDKALKGFFGGLDDYVRFDLEIEMENARIDEALLKAFDEFDRYAENFDSLSNAVEGDAERAAEAAQEKWIGTLNRIEGETADIFFDMFQNVEDGWSNLWDTAKDIFFRTLAEIAARAAMTKIIVPVMTYAGMGPGQAQAGAVGGSGGGVDWLGLGSNAYSLYSGYTGESVLGGISSTVIPGTTTTAIEAGTGAAAEVGGVTLGSAGLAGALGSLGYTYLGGMIGLPQGQYSGVGSGLGAAGGYAAGAAIAKGTAFGSYGGPVGAIVGAIVSGVLSAFIGGNTKRMYAGGLYRLTPDSENLFGFEKMENYSRRLDAEGYKQVDESMEFAIGAVVGSFSEVYEKLGDQYKDAVFSQLGSYDFKAYARDHDDSDLAEEFGEALSRASDALSEYLAGAFRSVLNMDYLESEFGTQLAMVGEGSELSKLIEGLSTFSGSDTEYLQEIGTAIGALEEMGRIWDDFSKAAERMVEPLTAYEKELESVNQQFDGWIATLEALGFSVSKINEIEAMRTETLENLREKEESRLRDEAISSIERYLSALRQEEAELRNAANSARGAYIGGLQERIADLQGQQALIEQAAAGAKQNYIEAIQREIQAQREAMASIEIAENEWEGLSDTIRQSRLELLTGSGTALRPDQAYDAAQSQFSAVLARVMGGDAEAVDELTSVAGTVLETARGAFAKPEQYRAIFEAVQSGLSQAENFAAGQGLKSTDETQIELAEKNIERLEAQLEEIYSSGRTLLSIDAAASEYHAAMRKLSESELDEQIGYFQAELAKFDEQLDLDQLRNEWLEAQADIAESNHEDEIKMWERELAAMQQVATGIAGIEGGLTGVAFALHNLNSAISDLSSFGGYAGGGISYGPSSGHMEMLHGTEAVIPLDKGDVPVRITGGADKETAKLLSALLAETRENRSIQKKLYRLMDRISGGQDSLKTRTS